MMTAKFMDCPSVGPEKSLLEWHKLIVGLQKVEPINWDIYKAATELIRNVHGLPEPDRGPCYREVNIELNFFHPRRDELRAAAAAAYLMTR